MQEAVSTILYERSREAEGLSRMLVLSVGAHVAIVAAVWLMPADWRSRSARDVPVMTISLGGPSGADTGGMTSIADRAVQSIAKPNEPKAIETPPAAKVPEMVEPDRIVKPTVKPRAVDKPADASKAPKPTAGAAIKEGSARVKTGGAAIPFGGLSSSSAGAGDGVRLDVQNFCCPQYILLMKQHIQSNWNPNQGATGQPEIKFTIRRDGMLTNVELEKSSGQALLDLEARRAVLKTIQLPPLPREFTGENLTVHLVFDFKR